jgi:hypothetical protein
LERHTRALRMGRDPPVRSSCSVDMFENRPDYLTINK